MRMFFFDMKDGVPLRDLVGIEFMTSAEAIEHSKELAQHFRDESLRDDRDLEISVVNASGREIHREFVSGKSKTSASERHALSDGKRPRCADKGNDCQEQQPNQKAKQAPRGAQLGSAKRSAFANEF